MGAVLRSLLACSFCSLMRGERGGRGRGGKVAGVVVAVAGEGPCLGVREGSGEAWLPAGPGAGAALPPSLLLSLLPSFPPSFPPFAFSRPPPPLPGSSPTSRAARPASGHRTAPLLFSSFFSLSLFFQFFLKDLSKLSLHVSLPPLQSVGRARPRRCQAGPAVPIIAGLVPFSSPREFPPGCAEPVPGSSQGSSLSWAGT